MISEAPGVIDSLGAFVSGCAPGGRVESVGAAEGPLSGLSFADTLGATRPALYDT